MCWAKPSYQDEFLRFVKAKAITDDDDHFVGTFNGEISVPERIPGWLWGGILPQVPHPTGIRICLGEHTLLGNAAGHRPSPKPSTTVEGDDYASGLM